MNIAMVDVPGCVICTHCIRMNIVRVLWLHIYISAWGSALLVQLDWAMRRPRNAGRVMIQAPALFLCGCIENQLTNWFGEFASTEIIFYYENRRNY